MLAQVKAGALTLGDARAALTVQSAMSTPIFRGSGSAPAFRKSKSASGAEVDTSGDEACNSTRAKKITAAVSWLKSHANDISSTCVKNDGTDWACSGSAKTCFAGHAKSSNPRTVLSTTLASSDFVIHCYDCWLKHVFSPDAVAFTNCGQWEQAQQDIHLCIDFVDSANAKEIACVIAHEIMHVWGADENAADAMVNKFAGLPSTWDCP